MCVMVLHVCDSHCLYLFVLYFRFTLKSLLLFFAVLNPGSDFPATFQSQIKKIFKYLFQVSLVFVLQCYLFTSNVFNCLYCTNETCGNLLPCGSHVESILFCSPGRAAVVRP